MERLASIEDLSVSFGGRVVLEPVRADLPAEGTTVIVGRSGSGKTTFLRAFNRLNEEFPGCATRGQITLTLGGRAVPLYPDGSGRAGLTLSELRRRVGMVFQSPNVFPCSIQENVLLPLRALGLCDGEEAAARARRALEDAGLWEEVADRLRRPAETLSGGQQQRLCLARALALEPEILLLDEPTASLDARASERVERLLSGLAETRRLLLVSHNLAQALRLADRIWVFSGGRLTRAFSRPFPSEAELAALL